MTTNTKKRYFSEIQPRFSDFDLQGILNSMHYVNLLNEARFEQMGRCYNHPIENYVKRGQHWVASHLSFNFLSPIYPGRKVLVFTEVCKIEGAAAFVDFSFETEVNGGFKVHTTGKAEYVLVDLKTKVPVKISDDEHAIFL